MNQILCRLKDSPIIVKHGNKRVAVMIGYDQYQKFEAILDLAEDLVLGATALKRDRAAKKGSFAGLGQW